MKLTTSEIKTKYGIGPTTIRKWVQNNKLTIPENYQKGQPFKIDEDELLKIKKMYWNDGCISLDRKQILAEKIKKIC